SAIMQMLEKDPRRRPTAGEATAVFTELSRGRVHRPVESRAKPLTVGRDRERDVIWRAFESAASGCGQFIAVAGERGIGKTTFVEDFLSHLSASDRSVAVARGRCSERLAGSEAYLPVLEALESLIKGEIGESAARVMCAVAPTWHAHLLPPSDSHSSRARPESLAQADSTERRKRELILLLKELTRIRTLVFFLDDIHWADVSTVDLLAYIGARCAGMRLLVVLTYRPSEMLRGEHPFIPIQLELQRHNVARELRLDFLTRDDGGNYLDVKFPGHSFPADFLDLLYAKTSGSPLFLVDLIRYLRDRGVIAEGPRGWALAAAVPDFERELPESVRSMIQRGLTQLADPDRRLLSAASVQGNEFDSAVVARVLQLGPADVEERLEVLDRVHGLVRLVQEFEFPDGTFALRYRFVHVLYQNALFAGLQPSRKAAWSAGVAAALLELFGKRAGNVAGELAHLFEVARDWGRAAEYF